MTEDEFRNNQEPDGTTFNDKVLSVNEPEITQIEQTLSDREQIYGSFVKNAYISQSLKRAVRDGKNYDMLPDYQKEAIDMIFYKIARAITGDPNYPDNWHDIAGYALLVENTLKNRKP